jgi:hypothetical protein
MQGDTQLRMGFRVSSDIPGQSRDALNSSFAHSTVPPYRHIILQDSEQNRTAYRRKCASLVANVASITVQFDPKGIIAYKSSSKPGVSLGHNEIVYRTYDNSLVRYSLPAGKVIAFELGVHG